MNENLMNQVIEEQLKGLRELDPNSETYKATVEAVVALKKAQNEADKIDQEREAHDQDIAEAKKERIFRAVICGIEVLVPATVYVVLFNKGLMFEETGTVTSGFFKGLTNKIRPTK